MDKEICTRHESTSRKMTLAPQRMTECVLGTFPHIGPERMHVCEIVVYCNRKYIVVFQRHRNSEKNVSKCREKAVSAELHNGLEMNFEPKFITNLFVVVQPKNIADFRFYKH